MDVVAVDIGGTHCRFALARIGDGPPRLGPVTVMRTIEYASLSTAWAAFAATVPAPLPRIAGIAFAGPVGSGVMRLTNNPWVIDPQRIAAELGLDDALLINDFGAVAHAVDALGEGDFVPVAGPDVPLPARGVVTIVGPGTGLGVAQLVRGDTRAHVIETEGGHADFAPLDALEDALVARLRQRHRRVSIERVVAGPGLAAIYETICAVEGHPVVVRDDKALWTAALDRSDALAASALDRFCLCLGAVAGDLALTHGAGAVVIAGGLGQRLKAVLPRSGFAPRFVAKGRFEGLMAQIPVRLVTYDQPGLLGAAVAVARHGAG